MIENPSRKVGGGVERGGQEINRVEVGVGRSDGLEGTTDCVGVCVCYVTYGGVGCVRF